MTNDRCRPDELVSALDEFERRYGRRQTWHSAPRYSPPVAARVARWIAERHGVAYGTAQRDSPGTDRRMTVMRPSGQ